MNSNPAAASGPPLPPPRNSEEKRKRSNQYYGYPALSEWMSSSHDFLIVRRYSKSFTRCVLRLQHEIAKLEKELEDIDKLLQSQPMGYSASDTFDKDMEPARPRLIEKLEVQLQRYYNLVNSFTEIRKRPTARDYHVENLKNWFESHEDAIQPEERHFLAEDKQGDLFPIITKDMSPLRLFLGKVDWLRLLFAPRRRAGQINSRLTVYTSETALDLFTNMVILLTGLTLLFAPMWTLHFVTDDIKRLGIITGFVTAFTGLAWSAAGQRPFEVMAATAAYTAVLMVYLQNNDV